MLVVASVSYSCH